MSHNDKMLIVIRLGLSCCLSNIDILFKTTHSKDEQQILHHMCLLRYYNNCWFMSC